MRATRTLLITDAAVYVPAEAPEIVGAEMVERTGSYDNVLLRTLKAINYGGGFRKRAEVRARVRACVRVCVYVSVCVGVCACTCDCG